MEFKQKNYLNFDEIILFLNKNHIDENSIETFILFYKCNCEEYGKITKIEFEKIKDFKSPNLKNFLIGEKKKIFGNLENLRKLFFYAFDFYSLEDKYFKIPVYICKIKSNHKFYSRRKFFKRKNKILQIFRK